MERTTTAAQCNPDCAGSSSEYLRSKCGGEGDRDPTHALPPPPEAALGHAGVFRLLGGERLGQCFLLPGHRVVAPPRLAGGANARALQLGRFHGGRRVRVLTWFNR